MKIGISGNKEKGEDKKDEICPIDAFELIFFVTEINERYEKNSPGIGGMNGRDTHEQRTGKKNDLPAFFLKIRGCDKHCHGKDEQSHEKDF